MAGINTKQAGAWYRAAKFAGIDRSGEIADLVNFRLRADGALERRCGYALSLTLGAAVRGVWAGSFLGEEAVFAAAGTGLYRLDLDAGQATQLGSIASGEGRVALFLWRGTLCCLDGAGIWLWDGERLAAAEPYVPLIGRERGQTELLNIHEPINLLTRKARFTFRAEGLSYFYFGCAVSSIGRVYNITRQMEYVDIQYDLRQDAEGRSYLLIGSAPEAGNILYVAVTLDERYLDDARIAACTDAVVWGGAYDDRILCWGGGGASELFCSRPVSAAQLEDARLWGGTSGELYFPLGSSFHLGDGRYPLRAACRHYDRLLIFTSGDAWEANFADSGGEQLPVLPVNSGVGCSAPGAAVQAGNDPLAVADGAIMRWQSRALRRDECSAASVSAGLGVLSEGFSAHAVACGCRARQEVWFADPTDAEGGVYIYHTGLDAWYRFSGIAADGLFCVGGEIGFWRGRSFYRFDEGRESDLDADGERPIPVQLVLEGLDFGASERRNHLTRMALQTEGVYPALTVTCTTECGRSSVCSLAAGGTAGQRSFCERPLRSGRFRHLRLTVSAGAGPRLCLRGLMLTAEPGER